MSAKCEYCEGTGDIESDNNGPIYKCPVCEGLGYTGSATGNDGGDREEGA